MIKEHVTYERNIQSNMGGLGSSLLALTEISQMLIETSEGIKEKAHLT